MTATHIGEHLWHRDCPACPPTPPTVVEVATITATSTTATDDEPDDLHNALREINDIVGNESTLGEDETSQIRGILFVALAVDYPEPEHSCRVVRDTGPAHPTRAPQAPGAPHSPHPAPEVGSTDLEASAGTTAMRAEDVPDELADILGQKLYDENSEGCAAEGCDGHPSRASCQEWARELLAAVLPAHEAMVRAEVAEEIEAQDTP